MTLVRLAGLLPSGDESRRWRLVAEFLEEYRWESVDSRSALLRDEPASTNDEHWDVMLAGLAEHLAARDGHAADCQLCVLADAVRRRTAEMTAAIAPQCLAA
jgi:hypothetical protein